MRILFFIDRMASGGAARLITLIANELSKRNYDIYVATNLNVPVNYQLMPDIKLINSHIGNMNNRLLRFFRLLKSSRKIAQEVKPDIIISTQPPVCFYSKLATIGLGIPTVFCDVTTYARKCSPFVHFVRYYFYALGDAVTIQTQNDAKILGKRLPKKVVINNPLSYPVFKGKSDRKPIILAIGDTNRWHIKGFDRLLKIFERVSSDFHDWELHIVGPIENETYEELMSMIDSPDVLKRICFDGFKPNINEYMRSCSIFALSSRIEGFSLSLTEALSQGLPSVAYSIHGVIDDVTENGHGTLLVEDDNDTAFEESLRRLMQDEELRTNLSQEGIKFVQKYSPEMIADCWESLLNRLINEK